MGLENNCIEESCLGFYCIFAFTKIKSLQRLVFQKAKEINQLKEKKMAGTQKLVAELNLTEGKTKQYFKGINLHFPGVSTE